ncbi:hypothetical protein A2V71_04185 [Candidatus Berkelbacteria bacterium RBG_13_40_8]|uniref:PSP1 C-terminal domain-containing protein n=1 Tax=Candidatus Berkelbacteria bacterium RBG_13_40_8 TaxID=1797467 RepID=A0A1F5DNW3_9BACT|nr:MAG: hypothetical protein A2V71_04185 [Candidatus Berkelbacteria bacterium RBG_13_40_8]
MYKLRIPSTGQIFTTEFDLSLKPGQEVLVELEGIVERATIVCQNCSEVEDLPNGDPPKIIRVLNEADIIAKKALDAKAKDYLEEARVKVFRHGLQMKILDATLSFDEKKLTFYFSAEGRVDFRALVSDMVGSFHKIIRLQQVGARDEARLYGGYGKCGRELCCAKFLANLESITLEMAEIQEVSSGKPSKITGCCGKLMCCLSYEADSYKKIKLKMPKIGSEVKTPQGEGKVIGHNVFENKIMIETKEGKKLEVMIDERKEFSA